MVLTPNKSIVLAVNEVAISLLNAAPLIALVWDWLTPSGGYLGISQDLVDFRQTAKNVENDIIIKLACVVHILYLT